MNDFLNRYTPENTNIDPKRDVNWKRNFLSTMRDVGVQPFVFEGVCWRSTVKGSRYQH